MIRAIEGRNNQSLKLARKLQKKKHRRERGLYVVEGMDLLLAGLEAGELPAEVLVREDLLERLPAELLEDAREDELDVGVCSADTLAAASSLGGAADVVALFEMPEHSLADLEPSAGLTVFLLGVGDPGNVGTVIRSAAAFGAGGVALSPGSADPHSPKALRAAMGSQFLIPVVTEVSSQDLVGKLLADEKRFGVPGGRNAPTGREAAASPQIPEALPWLILADPQAVSHLGKVPLGPPAVLVLGSERGGLEEMLKAARAAGFPSERVREIAIGQARFDSLNLAMAASIFLYELSGSGSRGI